MGVVGAGVGGVGWCRVVRGMQSILINILIFLGDS